MNQISRCQPGLGTLVEINIQGDCDDAVLIEASRHAFAVISEVTQAMSFHDQSSELSIINQQAHHQPVKVGVHTARVLHMAQQMYQDSAGVFDVSVGSWLVNDGLLPETMVALTNVPDLSQMKLNDRQVRFKRPLTLDLGGIAKGYAVDVAMDRIKACLNQQLIQASVNAGGDMKVYDWHNYEVLVPDVHKQVKSLYMKRSSVASSSSYYLAGNSAIYDPKQGCQVELGTTVSVFADSCMVADALTKVAAVVGKTDPIFERYEAEVMMV